MSTDLLSAGRPASHILRSVMGRPVSSAIYTLWYIDLSLRRCRKPTTVSVAGALDRDLTSSLEGSCRLRRALRRGNAVRASVVTIATQVVRSAWPWGPFGSGLGMRAVSAAPGWIAAIPRKFALAYARFETAGPWVHQRVRHWPHPFFRHICGRSMDLIVCSLSSQSPRSGFFLLSLPSTIFAAIDAGASWSCAYQLVTPATRRGVPRVCLITIQGLAVWHPRSWSGMLGQHSERGALFIARSALG